MQHAAGTARNRPSCRDQGTEGKVNTAVMSFYCFFESLLSETQKSAFPIRLAHQSAKSSCPEYFKTCTLFILSYTFLTGRASLAVCPGR